MFHKSVLRDSIRNRGLHLVTCFLDVTPGPPLVTQLSLLLSCRCGLPIVFRHCFSQFPTVSQNWLSKRLHMPSACAQPPCRCRLPPVTSCVCLADVVPPLHPNCRTLAAHNFQRSSGRGPQSFPDCVSLFSGCLRVMVLQMPLYLFPWPLYVSPYALCCPARRMSLFTCLPSCVSWCAYTSVRLFTCPLLLPTAESRWISISRSWGASPLLIDPHMYAEFREARSSVPRCVSQHISALSSTLSLALLTALFSTASPTLSPTLCPTLSPSMFPTAPPTLHPAAFSNASCNALRLQRVPEICFRLVFHFVIRLLPFSFQSLGPLVSKWGFPDVVSQQSPGWCGSFFVSLVIHLSHSFLERLSSRNANVVSYLIFLILSNGFWLCVRFCFLSFVSRPLSRAMRLPIYLSPKRLQSCISDLIRFRSHLTSNSISA